MNKGIKKIEKVVRLLKLVMEIVDKCIDLF